MIWELNLSKINLDSPPNKIKPFAFQPNKSILLPIFILLAAFSCEDNDWDGMEWDGI